MQSRAIMRAVLRHHAAFTLRRAVCHYYIAVRMPVDADEATHVYDNVLMFHCAMILRASMHCYCSI